MYWSLNVNNILFRLMFYIRFSLGIFSFFHLLVCLYVQSISMLELHQKYCQLAPIDRIENNFKVIKTRIGRNFSFFFFFKFVPREEVFQVRENDSFESDLTACSLIKKTGTG